MVIACRTLLVPKGEKLTWLKVTFFRFSCVGFLPQFWKLSCLCLWLCCTLIHATTHTTTEPTTLKVPREPKGSVSSFLHNARTMPVRRFAERLRTSADGPDASDAALGRGPVGLVGEPAGTTGVPLGGPSGVCPYRPISPFPSPFSPPNGRSATTARPSSSAHDYNCGRNTATSEFHCAQPRRVTKMVLGAPECAQKRGVVACSPTHPTTWVGAQRECAFFWRAHGRPAPYG